MKEETSKSSHSPQWVEKFLRYSRKDFKKYPGFDPITFTFSENSNYGQESLIEMYSKYIAGHCPQSFENKKLVTSPSNVLPNQLK